MCAQNASQQSGDSPSDVMLRLISGAWISRALYAAVKLGIPDMLKDQVKRADELADATRTHAPSLYRMMNLLVSVGVLTRDQNNYFGLTPLGATLRTGEQGSLRAWALHQLGDAHYQAWGDVLHSIQTGETAFEHQFGMDVWQYRAMHPEQSAIFDEAMASLIHVINQAILVSYDFSTIRKIVDVGGGNGGLLIYLLNGNPNMSGVVFDSPHVAERAKSRIEAAKLTDRCTSAGGDFFVSVPGGGDAYILSRVIHDWDDEHSIAILKNCRSVMSEGHKLLIMERVVPTEIDHSTKTQSVTGSDLNMLVIVGGQERSEAEYRTLLDAAGFKLTRVVPTRSVISIIEAVPI